MVQTFIRFLMASFGILFLLVLNKFKVHSLIPYLVLGIPMVFYDAIGYSPNYFRCSTGLCMSIWHRGSKHSPIKLQHCLHLPVAFIVPPLFTLANTAIPFKTEFISGLTVLHSIGIGLGLLIGKTIRIMLSFVITELKIVKLPEGITWYDVLALGCVAGIRLYNLFYYAS